MKIIYSLTCLAAFVFLALTGSAQAATSQHLRDAFYFADRKNWHEAQAHARAASNRLAEYIIFWQRALDGESGASFEDIAWLMKQHPDWPYQSRLQIRAEQAMDSSNVSDQLLLAWFDKHPPITGAGMIAQAQAMLKLRRTTAETRSLISKGWIQGDFTADHEKRILASLAKYLTMQDHIKRTDRLLWEEKLSAAERMLPRITPSEAALAQARIALVSDDKKAPALLAKLPAKSQKHPGVTYARLVWRSRRDDDKGAVEMLKLAPKNPPFPEKWWPYRERQVRTAIDQKDYALAAALLKPHGLTEGADYAEAVWLKGWLNLRFLKNPQDAYLDFHHMYENVSYAVSRARAAYWAGRAAEAMKQQDIAASWYANASNYPATFYGQLAHHKSGSKQLALADASAINESTYRQFVNSEWGQIIRLCLENNQPDTAMAFIKHILDANPTTERVAAITNLAQEYGGTAIGTKAAKRGGQLNIFLASGYPTPKLGGGFPIELPLVYAIIRQESEFDRMAQSRAGAMGLMQLLPSTAQQVAKREGLGYAKQRLYEPEYNAKLGSIYLGRLINAYDGSYVKAIAGYNAGPGRVRQWLAQFGYPSGNVEQMIDWIEKIPFSETRNYVQRVLENLQVYRAVYGGEEQRRLSLEADLLR